MKVIEGMGTSYVSSVIRPWVLGLCLGLLHGLVLMAPAIGQGNDGRFFLQDNKEQWRGEFESLRLRKLQRVGEIQQPPDERGSPSAECLPIRALRLSGVTLLSMHELATLREQVLQHSQQSNCLDGAQLQYLLQRLTGLYVAQGFIAARVLPKTTSDGVMTLQVMEGHIERIEGEDRAVRWLFPRMEGKPLNIRDLEQGLDQANRLQSSAMRAEVIPGSMPGSSAVRLLTASTDGWHGRMSLDNWGYDSTGRQVLGLSVARDNLSGRYDYLSLSGEHSLDQARFSRRVSLFYSLPDGYWTYSLFAGQSEYLNTLPLRYRSVELRGTSVQGGLRIDRVLARDQHGIWSAHGQLAHKRVENYFLGSLQTLSSPTLTVTTLGIDYMRLLPAGSLMLEVSQERGRPWLNAECTPDDMPQSCFSKWVFGATLRHALPVPGWQVESRFTAQTSQQFLPAVEQLELADNNMVRGFRHNSLSSEQGWAWHNTLQHAVRTGAWLWQPRVAWDVGGVWQTHWEGGYQQMAGWGVGLTISRGPLSLDIEYNRPLWQPDDFVSEPRQILVRLAWQF